MLHVTQTDADNMVGIGRTVRAYRLAGPNSGIKPVGWDLTLGSTPWGWYTDRGTFDSLTFLFRFGFLPAQELVRQKYDGGDIIRIGDRKPVCKREYDRADDRGRYGTVIGPSRSLDSVTATNRRRFWTRESDIIDTSARGYLQAETEGRSVFWNRSNITIGSWTVPRFATLLPTSFNPAACGNVIDFLLSYNPTGYYARDSGSWNYGGSQIFADELPSLESSQGPLNVHFLSGYETYDDSYSDFEWVNEGDAYSGESILSYHWVHKVVTSRHMKLPIDCYPSCTMDYLVTFTLSYQNRVKSALRNRTSSFSAQFNMDTSWSFRRKYELISQETNVPVPPDLAPFVDTYETSSEVDGTTVRVSPLRTSDGPGSRTTNFSDPAVDVPLLRVHHGRSQLSLFSKMVDSIHGDIRAATALSANACLDSYQSDMNLLESMPELPGMLKNVKNISRFTSLISEISKGNPEAVVHIIDMMADGYLLYKYGLRPLASDISESKRIAKAYYEQMDIISSGLQDVLYGDFFFEIPMRMPSLPGKFSVMVRSKMVLRHGASGPLAYAIAMDGVGLLPTLARIWDLVPFSFVVDWFTSLGDRYEDIDNFVARSALAVDYYVHTFTYTYVLEANAYLPFQRKPDSDPPHFRRFVREKSLYHPRLGMRSRFDFHPPRGLKKTFLSAGALLWSSDR